MAAPKYARRVDGNHAEIVEALRYVVAKDHNGKPMIYVIHEPLDLLVMTKNWEWQMIEVKRPDAKPRSDQKEQTALLEFARKIGAPIHKCTTIEEAVSVVSDLGK